MVAAAAMYFGDLGITARAALIVVFFVLTAPVAAHLLSRAAYHSGVLLWEKTQIDELRATRSRLSKGPKEESARNQEP